MPPVMYGFTGTFLEKSSPTPIPIPAPALGVVLVQPENVKAVIKIKNKIIFFMKCPQKIKFLYHSITLKLSLMQEMKFNFTDFQKN